MSNTVEGAVDLTRAVEVAMQHGLSRAKAMVVVTRVAPFIQKAANDAVCADPACAQIREWYLADEVKLAKIRKIREAQGPEGYVMGYVLDRILDGEPRP